MICSEASVFSLPYPDFVGLIGQENAPPGGLSTIDFWIENGNIGDSSTVLDLACSTGYSARNVAQRSGALALGIDISETAIVTAQRKAQDAQLSGRCSFRVGNAEALDVPNAAVTHVVAGACFGFFQNPSVALKEAKRVLNSRGCLGVANFHYIKTPPSTLLDQVEEAIGYRPDPNRSLDYWQEFYASEFNNALTSVEMPLPISGDSELREACERAIFEESDTLKSQPAAAQRACFERLYRIRKILNEHRAFQGYTCAIWTNE